MSTSGCIAPQDHQQQDLALRVLLSANPSSSYGKQLLRSFHKACSDGRTAALRTIGHLRLDLANVAGMPYPKQLAMLAAADQATALTISASQIAGLLQELVEVEEEQDACAAMPAADEQGMAVHDNPSSSSSSGSSSSVHAAAAAMSSLTITTTTNSSNSSKADTDVSSMARGVMAVQPAAKPTGPCLTHLRVTGRLTEGSVHELMQLLDALPAAQHLLYLVLQQPAKTSYFTWGLSEAQVVAAGLPWPAGPIRAALEDSPSRQGPAVASAAPDNSSSRGCDSSSRSTAPGAGGCGSSSSSWRSNCHTLVAGGRDVYSTNAVMDITCLGPLLAALPGLQVLYLHAGDMAGLPECAAALPRLRALHVCWSDLRQHPVVSAALWLTELRHLAIAHTRATRKPFEDPMLVPLDIPDAFTTLVHLTSLDLSATPVTNTGLEVVCGNTRLKALDLTLTPHVMALPDSISRLTGLEVFTLGESGVDSLPETMTALRRLHKLTWTNNNHVPLDLGVVWRLSTLQQLSLGDHYMDQLPDGIGQLTALTELSVAGGASLTLTNSMGSLAQLRRLAVSASGPVILRSAITALTQLASIKVTPFPRDLPYLLAVFVRPRRAPY